MQLLHAHSTTTRSGSPHNVLHLSSNYVSLLSDRLSAHAYKRENGVTNEAIVIEWAAAAAWWRLGGSEKAMGRCTARLKMLLFRAKTIVTD